jgi:hypothetical protein
MAILCTSGFLVAIQEYQLLASKVDWLITCSSCQNPKISVNGAMDLNESNIMTYNGISKIWSGHDHWTNNGGSKLRSMDIFSLRIK